jgi:hypothetical protein
MIGLISLPALALLAVVFKYHQPASATAIAPRFEPPTSRERYSHAHSLGPDYHFSVRDGWTTLNVSDLAYKYKRISPDQSMEDSYAFDRRMSRKDRRSSTKKSKSRPNSKAKVLASAAAGGALGGLGGIGDAIDNVGNVLHGIGNTVPVIITWYTGHDLENPSCWSESVWTPSVSPCHAHDTLLALMMVFRTLRLLPP